MKISIAIPWISKILFDSKVKGDPIEVTPDELPEENKIMSKMVHSVKQESIYGFKEEL